MLRRKSNPHNARESRLAPDHDYNGRPTAHHPTAPAAVPQGNKSTDNAMLIKERHEYSRSFISFFPPFCSELHSTLMLD